MLNQCLEILLDIPWLSILKKAGIMLVETDAIGTRGLRLVASKNLGPQIESLCSNVAFGQCLCGRVAQSGQPLHASCLDERHDTLFEGIEEHGHYIVPMIAKEELLGVMVFYLPPGSTRDEEQLDFLSRCASVLALALALRRNEQRLAQTIRELDYQKKALDLHSIVSITDRRGNITYANDRFCSISGYSQEELLGNNHRMLKSGEHSPAFYADLWTTITRGQVWRGEIKNRKKDGGSYWVSATIVPFLDDAGTPYQFVSIRTDITERKQIESALKLAQSVAAIGSWSLDLLENRLTWSDEIYRIFGIDPDAFGASMEAFLETIHPEDLEQVQAAFQRSIDQEDEYDIEHRILRRDNGEIRWVHERCLHQRNAQGEVIRSDGTVQDITERRQAQEQVRRLAMTDHLTGLANRGHFDRRFDEGLALARREGMRMGLMLIDLDRFKPVNDTYGHHVGDALLVKVAELFLAHNRASDLVARIGGDEFAILLFNPDTRENIEKKAARILDAFRQPLQVDGQHLSVGASIGISLFPDDGETKEALMLRADLALYAVKRSGRGGIQSFCSDLLAQAASPESATQDDPVRREGTQDS